MPEHDHDSRERVLEIREGSKFQLDLKTIVMLCGMGAAVAGSWFEQKARVSSLEYEIRAEITRVETAGEKRSSSIETKVDQVQETTCAIAAKLDVPTIGCRRQRGGP